MTTTTDTDHRAAERRVAAFLKAQTEEDNRSQPTPELAWAVPDYGRLTTLYTADLHALLARLAELEAANAANIIVLGSGLHPAEIRDADTNGMQERWHELGDVVCISLCRCSPECYWDDPEQIDAELTRRGVR